MRPRIARRTRLERDRELDAEREWRIREDASYAAYIAACARAHGYDEDTIERAVALLPLRRRGGRFVVRARHIAIELTGGAVAVFRNPNKPDREETCRENA